jgi:amino acid permease
MTWWKIWDSNGRDGEPKTVNMVQGYFFLVNFCIGTGFLGIPFSFFYSGYLAAVPTLLLTAFCTWVTARWLLEIMARAQVGTVIPIIIIMLIAVYC